MKKFGDINFLASLDHFIDNESVVGFFVEQAVLQSIECNGLAVGEGEQSHMHTITFEGAPNFNTSKREVLYVPRAFNYPGIDGMVLRLNSDEMKASVFPLQITLAKYHKDSEATFFRLWKEWQKSLRDFDIDVTFLWITVKENSTTNVDEKSISLGSRKVATNAEYKSANVHLSKISMNIWNAYEEARESRMRENPSRWNPPVSGEPNIQAEEEEPPQRPTIDYRKYTVGQLREILVARKMLFTKSMPKAQLIDLLHTNDARAARNGCESNA
jgi:hypothetical protein